jgi:hypothetical protein
MLSNIDNDVEKKAFPFTVGGRKDWCLLGSNLAAAINIKNTQILGLRI